jgi:transcriptional regulator GlxA family with amidase domain
VLALESLGGGFARRLAERVADQTTPERQVAELQRALLEIHRTDASTKSVARAIALIDDHHGSIPVDVIADRTGASVRTLERLFRDSVGLSPKQLCRIARVRRAVSLLSRERPRWADVAHVCGYSDQAHFIREFKTIIGVAPSVFLEERAKPCSPPPSRTLCRKSSIPPGVDPLA